MIAFSILLLLVGIVILMQARISWKESKLFRRGSTPHWALNRQAKGLYIASAVCLFTSLCLLIRIIIDAQG